MNYLLPCDCGNNITVEAAQAGTTVRCPCGQELNVPTTRGLAQLQQVESAPAEEPQWSARQGLMFLGAILTAVGLVGAGYVYWSWPQLYVPVELLRAQHEELTPEHSWHVWEHLREGLEKESVLDRPEYRGVVNVYRGWLALALGVAALGLVFLSAPLWLKPPRQSEPRSARAKAGTGGGARQSGVRSS